jgi:hypothetical protein
MTGGPRAAWLVKMYRPVAALLTAALLLAPVLALADDWSTERLRGRVLQLVDGDWQPLTRGMVVPDSRLVRTLATGHVTFVRGEETVELGPNTQIQIFDKAGRKPFTTVKQDFGTVSVEAQIENVQHFAVDTPFLAAVVKGTRFIVTSNETGSSVRVRRGHVVVEDKFDKSHVLLSVGQSALVDLLKTGGDLMVGGFGILPKVEGGPLPKAISSLSSVDEPSGGLLTLGIGDEDNTGGLLDLGIGGSTGGGGLIDLGIGGGSLVGLSVGGGSGDAGQGLVNLNVGGTANTGGGGGDDDNSAPGNAGSGSRSGGRLININLGGIHLGL